MKRATACLYARVSTANHHQNPEAQLRDLRAFAKQRKWKITREYVDWGVSGAKDSRPELDKLMEDAKQHKVSAVLVARFDRMARSVSHLLRVLETFQSLGIAFVSLSEQIDTSTPAGKMVFTVLGAVAELERSLIGERIKAGLRNAKAKGIQLGKKPLRPLTPQDIAAIRRDRRQKRLPYAALAAKHRITVWTAYYVVNPKDVKAK